jgi:hypothetical protein
VKYSVEMDSGAKMYRRYAENSLRSFWAAKVRAKEIPRMHYQRTNSVALVCERSIPTERPPLVGEVSSKFFR